MHFLILIAVEIISATVIIGASTIKTVSHKILGTQIAQAQTISPDASPAPTDSPAPPPADSSPPPSESAPPAADQTAATPPPSPQDIMTPPPAPGDPFAATSQDQYPTNPEAPPDQSAQSSEPSAATAQSPTPGESPEAQPSATPNATTDQLNPIDYTPSQTTALVDPTQLLSSPENISEDTVNRIRDEEKKIENAQTPSLKANLLLDLIQDKVTQIGKNSDQNDFASANLNTLRLTDQVQKIQSIITSLPPSQNLSMTQKLQSFCKRTDFTLKSTQLLVPEEAEQDVEIARGTCLSTNL